MCRLSSAGRALILCGGQGVLIAATFPEPAEQADVWFKPT